MSEPRKKRGPVSYSTYQEAKDRIAELDAENARLRDEIQSAKEKYRELLYQVSCKFPNETRHETALRYLKEREAPAMTADQCCEALLGGGENG